MKYITNELKKGDRDNDEIIDVYYQDAVSKFNSNYNLRQIIDISKRTDKVVVKYEIV